MEATKYVYEYHIFLENYTGNLFSSWDIQRSEKYDMKGAVLWKLSVIFGHIPIGYKEKSQLYCSVEIELLCRKTSIIFYGFSKIFYSHFHHVNWRIDWKIGIVKYHPHKQIEKWKMLFECIFYSFAQSLSNIRK